MNNYKFINNTNKLLNNIKNFLKNTAFFWIVLAVFLIIGFPKQLESYKFPDTNSYASWPDASPCPPGNFSIGPRPPVYPIILKIFGTEKLLCVFQYFFSVFSWCLLGYVLGRKPGLVLGGFFAFIPNIYNWNLFALSESISFSLTALILAESILLMKKWTYFNFSRFVTILICFAFVRDQNLFMIPFLCLFFLFQPKKKLATIIIVSVIIFIVGSISVRINDRWQWGLTNNILTNVLPNSEARNFFQTAGMPVNDEIMKYSGTRGSTSIFVLQKTQPEFFTWIETSGLKTHYSYILTKRNSYIEPWKFLNSNYNQDVSTCFLLIKTEVFIPKYIIYVRKMLSLIIPPTYIVFVILIFLLGVWKLDKNGQMTSYVGLILLLGIYVQCFVSYHADTCSIIRHMLTGYILFYVVNGIALAIFLNLLKKTYYYLNKGEANLSTIFISD